MTNTHPHRIWFITGASSGIGLALTRAAIERGDNVVGLARNPEPLKDLTDTHPIQLLALIADVRDQSAIEAAVKQGLEKFGRIDVVAHSAGYGLWGAIDGGAVRSATVVEWCHHGTSFADALMPLGWGKE